MDSRNLPNVTPDGDRHCIQRAAACAAVAAIVALSGCAGIPTSGERQARADLAATGATYRPGGRRPTLPALDANATLGTLLTYAMLNDPRIEAAYHEYAAAVERITTERSLPDPRLGLELDIQDIVMVIMPGLMSELPWLGRLGLRAGVATAESQAKYHAFEAAVLDTAFRVKRAYYRLHFLGDKIRITGETLALMNELESVARAQSEAGKVTLQDVLRAQIEQDRLRNEIENLEDSRGPLTAQLKAALGLRADAPDPPMPSHFESTPLGLTADQLLATALVRNPRLKTMEDEVRMAETGIRLAHQSTVPDFNAGFEADANAAPVMFRPSIGFTVPLWRDKIAAEIAGAQARKDAAAARFTAEQIQLAVDVAERAFMYREATRNTKLIAEKLLPKARMSVDIARESYSAGRLDFINFLDAERTLLDLQLSEVDARTQRELALAEIAIVIAAIHPEGAPLPASAPDTAPVAPPKKNPTTRKVSHGTKH
jgi:outer membrane protein TolC